jgi:hypothetical protein
MPFPSQFQECLEALHCHGHGPPFHISKNNYFYGHSEQVRQNRLKRMYCTVLFINSNTGILEFVRTTRTCYDKLKGNTKQKRRPQNYQWILDSPSLDILIFVLDIRAGETASR